MKYRLLCVFLAAATVLGTGRQGTAQEAFPFEIFERYLKPLVEQIDMPGLSAAILQDGVVVRRDNVGYAYVERKIPPADDTPYPIGGITQAMAGVLHGVCIDRFTTAVFDIDRNIREFVPTFPVANTSVRQVLSH